jgi:hypothetical protein
MLSCPNQELREIAKLGDRRRRSSRTFVPYVEGSMNVMKSKDSNFWLKELVFLNMIVSQNLIQPGLLSYWQYMDRRA